ncbi:hypothetical protein PIROE2DRAFT_13296 [Piromyces sp. E2]|nr:hypothetical protein PIROE2DRAFT_13296 [Piromyces sp. E2]|eukprot:OUM60853.1 hypothetical protein PIROE2DRAFT_13296 [Piromyces sp. E2]
MASNTPLNNQNNVQQAPTSFTTPISISNTNGLNEININSERKENSPTLNKETIQQSSYPHYNIPNIYVNENENIKQNRKRHLSNSSTSISSHTLINNNYEEHVSNNPNATPSQYQRDSNKPIIMTTDTTTYNSTIENTLIANHRNSNINNSLPINLYNNVQNPSEKIYTQNKNKKQKIEYVTQIPQNQCQNIDKTNQKERVDSFNKDIIKNDITQNKKEFDIPNSMNYIYTREVQPSLIQNSNQLYNEIDNNNITQITDENELNKKQCYYHNNTSINNLNNKINFENDSNIDKFLKFNKNINDLTNYKSNNNNSTSLATLKTIKNQNELNNVNNINNTISINNKSNINKINTSSPTAVFHQTIEYPTSINVNVNTSISIPQVTTTTTIKPVIQNYPVSKDNSTPITTTTTLIPYSFQASSAPIAAYSTVTTTHSPKVPPQNTEKNGNTGSPMVAMESLHVSSPYYQNIYNNKSYISGYNNNNNNNNNNSNNNNYVMPQMQVKQGNSYQMGKSSYNISSLSNSPKSPVRQQSNNISSNMSSPNKNKNILYHSPLRNSINNNSEPEPNNNVSYPYFKNDDNQNDCNKQNNEMNPQQQSMNYNHYYNSSASGVKNKMNNNLLKNITTNNYLKRSMNPQCKEEVSNLNMYLIEQQNNEHTHTQLPSPPLTGYEDSNVHFDFLNNGNPNGSLYINDYKMYSGKNYPYNYSPVSPDKTYPLLKSNDQNVYSFNPSQINNSMSKYNNDDVKIMENNIIVNNMRVISQKNPVNIDMVNMKIINNNSNNDDLLIKNKMNIKDEINIDNENKQKNYYSDTKRDFDNQMNNSNNNNNNGQINNAFVKPMNKSSPVDSNIPSKKKYKVDNEINNMANNNNFKVIYSKKYSMGKSSKFKSNPPMMMNNKNENQNYHNPPPYTLPYTTMATTVISAPSPNPIKAVDNNSALITPVPIPQAIPNRKVNNILLNTNLLPLPEEIGNDSNPQQNQVTHPPTTQPQSTHQRKIISSQLYQNPMYDVNSMNMNTINRMYPSIKAKNMPPNNGKSIILPPPSSMPVFVPMNIPININNNNNIPMTLSTPSPATPPLIPINQQCSMVQQKSLQNNNYSLPIHYSSPCYPQSSPSNLKNAIPINTGSPINKKQPSNSHSHGNQMQIQNPPANYQIPNINPEIDQNQNQIQIQNQNQNNMALKRKHVNTKRISSGQEIISDDGTVTWKIIRQLGKGGCGEVYLAQFVSGKKQPYKYCAIKFIKNKKVFYAETNTMKFLMDNTSCDYSPKIYSSCPKQRFLLMEYIQGENLTQKFESCGHYFSLKTMLMVLMELMRLTKEFYTSTGLVHVDIKPSNFMVDIKNKIYLIDFGYATAPNVKLPGQTGTPLFMSQAIQSQGTICPSFQDDIESIGYVMMYFLKGGKLGLPWGLFKTHSEIVAAKTDANIYNFFFELRGTEYEPICNLLYNFLTVSRKRDIPFDEKDYNKLYDSIVKVFNDCGFVNDQCYDWNNIPKKV